MLNHMVVYPRGDRTRLSVAQVIDYEQDEWDLASKRLFDNTEEGKKECEDYMVELATRHGLAHTKKSQQLLD